MGTALGAGAVAALVCVAAAKGLGTDAWVWGGLGAAVMGLAAAWGVVSGVGVLSVRRRVGDERGALEVDRALGLRERLSSAMVLSRVREEGGGDRADAFVRLAEEEAERAAEGVSDERVRRGVPIWSGEGGVTVRMWSRRGWYAWPVTVMAAVACGVWMPAWSDAAQHRGEQLAKAEHAADERQAMAAELSEVLNARHDAAADDLGVMEEEQDAPPHERALAEKLEREYAALDELREQLEGTAARSKDDKALDPQAAAREAAESFSRLAEAQEEAAAEEELTADKLNERLASLDRQAAPTDADHATAEQPPESPIAEAIRRGNLARAREETRRLAERLTGNDAARQRQAAEELERLAEELERAAGTHSSDSTATERASREHQEPSTAGDDGSPAATEPSGSSPRAQERADAASADDEGGGSDARDEQQHQPKSTPRDADERGGRPDSADSARERRATERANEQVRELAERLKDAAREMRQADGAEDSNAEKTREQVERQGSTEQGARQEGRPDERAEPREEAARSAQPRQQETTKPTQGEQRSATPDERKPRSAMQRLAEQLQEMSECQNCQGGGDKDGEQQSRDQKDGHSGRAGELRRQAERNREMARRMLERATPEERRRINEAVRQLTRSGEGDGRDGRGAGMGSPDGIADPSHDRSIANGEPRRTEDVFAPSAEDQRGVDEQTVARWYSDNAEEPGPIGSGGGEAAREYVRSASRRAEKAVEERRVPSRYEQLLKRYFRRLPQRVGEAERGDNGGGGLAPDADAPRDAGASEKAE